MLHPTRVLDSLQGNTQLHLFSIRSHNPVSPYNTFTHAASLLYPDPRPHQPPIGTVWSAHKLLRDATAIMHVAGLTVHLLPSNYCPHAAYTDGNGWENPPREVQ